jgi:thiol-disulfide isomerase/thioredoxin
MTVYYFTADWCPGCKAFKPVTEQVSKEIQIPINYVNVDYDVSLTQKYSIKSIPTIVVAGQDGSEWFRHTGPMTPQQLKETFNRFR